MTRVKTDTALVNAVLIDAVHGAMPPILQAMAGVEPVLSTDHDEESAHPHECIWGAISFVGDQVWSLMLGFPRQTVVPMVQRFAGFAIDFDSPDMGDAVGEMANIVGGHLAAMLVGQGVATTLSLPAIARGHDVEIILPRTLARVRMAYQTALGPFWVVVASALSPGARLVSGSAVNAVAG